MLFRFQYTEFTYSNQFQNQFQHNTFDEFVDSTTNFAETDLSIHTGKRGERRYYIIDLFNK